MSADPGRGADRTDARGAPAPPAAPPLPMALAKPPPAPRSPLPLATHDGAPGLRLRTSWRRLLLLAVLLAAAGAVVVPRLLGPVIQAEPVQRGMLVQTLVASGRVETPHRVNIGSQLTGVVVEVPVREGQAVEAGQPLVTLDDRELWAGMEQAEGAVAEAEARLRQMAEVTLPMAQESLQQAQATLLNAQQQHDRAARLHASGFQTQTELESTRKALDVARAQVRAAQLQAAGNAPGGTEYAAAEAALRQARAALRAAQSRLDHTRIRAPVAGTLIGRNVEPGWVVQPGQVLMALSPAGETQIVVQIDEKNLGRIAPGQRALASADAYPDQRFAAELAYVNPAVDPERASVEAKLIVPSPPDYLRQDMTVSVDMVVAERADTLILPVSAVHDAAMASPWVLKVEGNHARRQPVRIGLRGPSQVEILEGLREGDRVVPAAAAVADGDRLRVARE
ncbi:efflux RND transporter periplasmic adaptor subunit [Roseomonas sp. E05]|uniref:efflux RND transporter periplasmic adaptor subunit n=1 Tax=Roseomonas sp. E05 TaxID=3046310 RepID=UPI0024BA4613|nr:efflux RND transporter periplasmic adaptor subunit [Roseomonas sp. E05]MDJ0389322.1 efflux RND transporter periplasmic adaptor subunit [Roseomonas sp. E05]